ncbi:alpha/beta hydrolase [Arenibacter sp. GZD96]|uniref:alpha/beta fold hydrolase n=1 Tax=Aurantibrevibacter litoralis TaxID=3106030 RepID=UPI002AFE91B6|nr:alpha/beta hydrolase [Arenibacter sp. GZD-96]MEA1787632.1 alpha/beta hydrolase [Arenibacter sp. GZD-96]
MKTKLFIGIIILITIAYLWPTKKYTFEENYHLKDAISESLKKFRQEPTKEVRIGKNSWKYHTAGKADTTIVFLHGMGGSYDIWWQQIYHFKTTYKTLSFTYPEVRSLEELSAGFLAILKQEKIDKVILVGSSLGGYLTQYLLVNHPDKIIKASIGNSFPPNTENKTKNQSLVDIMQWLPEWLVIQKIREKYNTDVIPAANNAPIVNAFLNELLGNGVTKETFINRYYCVIDPFEIKISDSIPVQIIESDNDPLVSENLRALLKKSYPKASLITLKAKGHFPYLNDAQNYNIALERFISKKQEKLK